MSEKQLGTVLHDIVEEMGRQDRKWGPQDHDPLYWLGILVEEVGEYGKAVIEGDDLAHIREEAVHAAAVAAQIVGCIDRRFGVVEA